MTYDRSRTTRPPTPRTMLFEEEGWHLVPGPAELVARRPWSVLQRGSRTQRAS